MSDKVIHLNSSNFDATIASDKPVLVDFWAPWCGPCRMLGPTIDELAETVGDSALICKLNVDESPDIAQKYGVNQIPTIIFFKNSKRLGASGMATKDALLAKLKAICKAARSTDRVVFYFAGHGGVDETQTGCICAYDKPIYYSELMSCFKQCRAKEKVMIVEACHSGSALTSYIAPGVTCLASSRMDEYSYYSDIISAGYFSKGILTGLQGKADANADKKITMLELYKYVYAYVLGKSQKQQHPQLIAPKSGQDIVIFDCTKL